MSRTVSDESEDEDINVGRSLLRIRNSRRKSKRPLDNQFIFESDLKKSKRKTVTV